MKYQNIDEIKKDIKAERYYPCYFLYGKDSYATKTLVDLLCKKVVDKGFESFNLQKFTQEHFDFNDMQTAYTAMPMMSKRKCVILHDVDLNKLSSSELDMFKTMLETPNISTVLLVYFTNINFEYKKTSNSGKIYDIIEKIGAVANFQEKSKGDIKKDMLALCKKYSTPITTKVCDQVIDYIGSDYLLVMGEVNKLIQYANKSEITMDMVGLLCVQNIQNSTFDLANAILYGNYSNAFEILDRLFYHKNEPVMILGALNSSFINLYRLKCASIANVSTTQVITDFKYKSSYVVTKLTASLSKFSIEQIRACIAVLHKTDVLIKSSKIDNKILLEKMLGEMMNVNMLKAKLI